MIAVAQIIRMDQGIGVLIAIRGADTDRRRRHSLNFRELLEDLFWLIEGKMHDLN